MEGKGFWQRKCSAAGRAPSQSPVNTLLRTVELSTVRQKLVSALTSWKLDRSVEPSPARGSARHVLASVGAPEQLGLTKTCLAGAGSVVSARETSKQLAPWYRIWT